MQEAYEANPNFNYIKTPSWRHFNIPPRGKISVCGIIYMGAGVGGTTGAHSIVPETPLTPFCPMGLAPLNRRCARRAQWRA